MTLRSLWQARHPRDVPSAPDLPQQADVVVVGGGITGVTTALLLARAGLSVAVLEARHLGAATTGGSTAKVSLLQGTRLSSISRLHPLPVVRRYVEANREGQAWLRRFCDDHGVAVDVRDAVTFAHDSHGAGPVSEEIAVAQAAGLDVVPDDDPPVPFPVAAAARLPDQLQLDPLAALEALADQAVAHGAVVCEGVRVRTVRGGGPCEVHTDAGTIVAGAVVVATGMPVLDRGAFFARMTPARSYGLAYSTPFPVVDAMYLSADAPSRSLRDAAGADGPVLLVGGAGHTTGRGGPTSAHLDELREWTTQWWPDAVETHAWSAQDYVPTRQLPYAGPILPGADRVLVAGGYAKWGMTNGVAAALALTARLTGGSMPWAEVLDPWALRGARGLPGGIRANVEVGLELGRGWLRPLLGADDVRYRGPGLPVGRPDGSTREVSAVCRHLGGVLSWNDAERSWDCPLHGSRFDEHGDVLEGPATCGLRAR